MRQLFLISPLSDSHSCFYSTFVPYILFNIHYLSTAPILVQYLLSITMPPSGVPIAPAGNNPWRQNERLIRRLYQDERRTLEQVKQTMETEYNFPHVP